MRVTRAGELCGFDVVSALLPSEVEPALDAALQGLNEVSARGREARVERLLADAKKRAGILDKLRGRAAERVQSARGAVPSELFEGRSGDGRVTVTLDGAFAYVHLTVAPGTPVEAALDGAREALAAAGAEVERCWASVLDGEGEEAREGADPAPAEPG